MKHPYSDWTIETLVDAATVYLPVDGTDWQPICKGAIEWLHDRASEDQTGAGAWFAWRACDPVHIAALAVERHSVGNFRGFATVSEPQSAEFMNGSQAGWCDLLFTLHKRRMEQYIAKKKLQELGGAG